jgi:hypothetical protein
VQAAAAAGTVTATGAATTAVTGVQAAAAAGNVTAVITRDVRVTATAYSDPEGDPGQRRWRVYEAGTMTLVSTTGWITPATTQDFALAYGDYEFTVQDRDDSLAVSGESSRYAFTVAAPGNEVYTHVASGGVVLAGSAVAASRVAYAATATGGLLVAGTAAAAPKVTQSVVASGGLLVSGTATAVPKAVWSATATGGFVLAGSVGVGTSVIYEATGTGGLSLTGVAATAHKVVQSATASGGLQLGGSAGVGSTNTYNVTATGGFVLAGSSTVAPKVAHATTASGGVNFAGSAAVGSAAIYAVVTSGGLQVGGSALVSRGVVLIPGCGLISVAGHQPSVSFTGAVSVIPSRLEMVLRTYPPAVLLVSGGGDITVVSQSSGQPIRRVAPGATKTKLASNLLLRSTLLQPDFP